MVDKLSRLTVGAQKALQTRACLGNSAEVTTLCTTSAPGRFASDQAIRVQLTALDNAYAERWVRSVKEECLSEVILFGERSLRRALSEYVEHYHAERNHQGKDNVLLFPRDTSVRRTGPVQCRVGPCVITIKRRRDRAPKAQS
jgi:hypothetical protein